MADAPKITNELFRFVTIRNPEPKTAASTTGSSSAVTYSAGNSSSALFRQIQTAKASASNNPAQALATINAAVKAFAGTDGFKKSGQEWDKLAPNVSDFISQYSAMPDEQRLPAAVKGLANKLFGSDAGPSAGEIKNSDLENLAWDNLFAYNIVGADVHAVQSVMNILRTVEGLKNLNAAGDGTVSKSQFQQVVLLPVEAFPLPRVDNKPDSSDGNRPSGGLTAEAIADLQKTFVESNRVSAAITDISVAYRRQIDEETVMSPKSFVPTTNEDGTVNPPEGWDAKTKTLGVLDSDFISTLTADTQKVLEERKLTGNITVQFVVQQLDNESAVLARSTYQQLDLGQQVIQVGNALLKQSFSGITTDPSTEHPADTKVFNGDLTPIDGRTVFSGCRVKPLGVADYRRVEQTLICYKPGEIAHIENILKGESKERSTRRLSRTEDTSIYTTETETTDERDTITTDRYQMEKETSKVVQQDNSLAVGVTVQGKYGPTSVTATANFSSANSSTQSDSQAVTYGKDVTERALRRVVERTSEQQIHKIIDEYEEINKHVVDNVGGAGHIVGLYRWVDKIYEAKVVNYGKRLMFEFLVPDPAAFHRFAMTTPVESQVSIPIPLDPVKDINAIKVKFPNLILGALKSADDISRANYLFWAGQYGAKVEAPPLIYKTVALGKSQTHVANDGNSTDAFTYTDLMVPDGYVAIKAFVNWLRGGSKSPGNVEWNTILVGNNGMYAPHGSPTWGSWGMNNETAMIPVSIIGRTDAFGLNVEVQCQVLIETFQAWQVKTFQTIMEAYNAALAQYNNAISEVKVQMGIQMDGTNPELNRQIEQMELKKHSVQLLSACAFVPSEAMKDNVAPYGYPEFNCCTAINDGKYVQFVEQCFDWELMTYTFYPYFWSRKGQWKTIYRLSDADPIFLQFLQAGYARVVVPVAIGYEEAAMRFAADGTIWNGGDVPGINDQYYRDIVDELKKPVGTVVGDPWQLRVPTTLTILQKDAEGIDASGLPCDPKGI